MCVEPQTWCMPSQLPTRAAFTLSLSPCYSPVILRASSLHAALLCASLLCASLLCASLLWLRCCVPHCKSSQAQALQSNTTLTSLCVGDCAMGDAVLEALAPAVAGGALLNLDLENKQILQLNPLIGHHPVSLPALQLLAPINLSCSPTQPQVPQVPQVPHALPQVLLLAATSAAACCLQRLCMSCMVVPRAIGQPTRAESVAERSEPREQCALAGVLARGCRPRATESGRV